MLRPSHARLAEALEQRFEALSPQMKKAASYLAEYPGDVALFSMREIAKRAGIPPATLLRLSSALGFDSYVSLREVYQDRLRQSQGAASFSDRARDLQRSAQANRPSELFARVMASEAENVEKTFAANDQKVLERAVRLVESARQVYVMGQRSCFPAAFYFNYVYRLFRQNSVLVDSNGGVFADELRGIGANDLLIAISIEPYTSEVVKATQFARREGARVLAVTDSRVSPIRKAATETLVSVKQSPSFFHSIIGLMALAHGLIAVLAARGGDKTPAAIAQNEKQLEWFHAYWPEAKAPRSS